MQGQKEWPVALYGGDFYDVVRAVWRPPVPLSLVTGATVAPRKAKAVWEMWFEGLENLATDQKFLPVLTRLQHVYVSFMSFHFI